MYFLRPRVLAVVLLAIVTALSPARAADTIEVVLSNLPQRGSTDYEALKQLAGASVSSELAMTHAETWSLAPERLPALEEAAARQGVAVMRLGEAWNHAFAPMPAGSPMSEGQKTMMHDTMRQAPVMGMTTMMLPPPEVLEHALTKNMDADDAAKPATLVVRLSDTLQVSIARTSIHKTKGGYAWHGAVAGTDEPATLIWWADGRLSGSVTYMGHVYSVRSLGGGVHGIIELAPNKLPPEHAPMSDKDKHDMGMAKDPLVEQGDASMISPKKASRDLEDAAGTQERLALLGPSAISGGHFRDATTQPEVVITVLVAYTRAAARFYGDIERDLVALAIEDANQSFRSSGLGHVRLDLAYAYETDYVENGSHFNHVFRFADKGDGVMDEVHGIRDQYKADVAVLIVDDPMGCGLAAQIRAPVDRAFAVVDQGCAQTSYSLAHEIGHLIGARHDMALDGSMQPFAYGHGFVNGTAWRTMMAYKESCGGCARVPDWSSPAIK
ncbi:MAG: M12 family metallo-peptidase, partial [Hyphomicrobium sp.]